MAPQAMPPQAMPQPGYAPQPVYPPQPGYQAPPAYPQQQAYPQQPAYQPPPAYPLQAYPQQAALPAPVAGPVTGRGAASWVVLDPNQPAEIEPPVPTFGMTLPDPARPQDDSAPAGGGLPNWLVALLSLLVVAGLGAGVVYFLKGNKGAAAATEVADSKEPTQQATAPHKLAKYIEITGLRLGEERQKVTVKFLVVNHSFGPLGGFELEVNVKAVNAKAEDPPLFTITTPVKNIGPLESRDFTVPVNTKMKGYEMPDWQFLRATFRVVNAD